jgi:hypothetical protein
VNGHEQSNPHLQAGLATGYLCRRTEEELRTIAAATGSIVSATELGNWLGRFLLSKSEAHTNGLDHHQRVSQVRGDAAEGYALAAGAEEIHVRPRYKRALSVEARAAIAKAQRKRWRLAKKAALGGHKGPLQSFKPASRSHSIAKAHGQKTYWAGMTPEERSKEMLRRVKVRKGDARPVGRPKLNPRVGNILPKGFWQNETTRLLAKGPTPRAEVNAALLKVKPGKKNAITVALATMKRHGVIREADGIMTLGEARA